MRISWLLFTIFIAPFVAASSSQELKLVSVQLLFNHGASAPSERITNPGYNEKFHRGLDEMTDEGFEKSHALGQYLKKRYVDTGFLDANLLPTKMFWRSVNKHKSLSTASTVGAAMFEDNVRHLTVPVNTEEINEDLLGYKHRKCHREFQYIKETCPGFNGVYEPESEFQELIANCLNFTHPVFKEYPFHIIEAHIQEYKNGIPLPAPIAQHIGEIMSIYVKVKQFITGTSNYHNPEMMKVKSGYLVQTLLDNFSVHAPNLTVPKYDKKGDQIKRPSKKRLNAFSTEDWVLMSVLDSFGVMNETIGLESYPEFNSMIIMELYRETKSNKTEDFYVKMFYKKEEATTMDHNLIDVTKFIRNCPSGLEYCPLISFYACCDEYQIGRGRGCKLDSKNNEVITYTEKPDDDDD